MNNTTPNPMFAKFDQALGKTTPTTTNSPVLSRADEIRDLAKNPPLSEHDANRQKAVEMANNTNLGKLAGDASDFVQNNLGGSWLKEHVATPLAQGEIEGVKSAVQRGKDLQATAIQRDKEMEGKPLLDKALIGGKTAGDTVGAIAGAAWDLVSKPIASLIPQHVKDVYGEETNKAVNDIKNIFTTPEADPEQEKIRQNVVGFFGNLAKTAKDNPEVTNQVQNLLKVLLLKGIPEGKALNMDSLKTAWDSLKNDVGSVTGTVKSTASDVVNGLSDTASGLGNNIKDQTQKVLNNISNKSDSELVKLQETISPKITSKETQNIINEGRLTRGDESPIFGKQPDIVEQSEAVQRSAGTISKQIPGASNMNDAELVNAINGKTSEMAQGLSGEMKNVPVKPETTGKVVDAWKNLKAEQQSMPEFLDNEAGNKAFQSKFENYLKELEWDVKDASGKFQSPTPKTMDDVWEVRKAYDDSIPSNVKNATEASSPILQGRKAMWLQNRSILNSAINDTYTGLGDTSQKAFSDMSDMYDAKQNILSKAKIDVKGKEGILPTTTKGWLKFGVGTGVTLLGGRAVLHAVGM